MTRTFTTAFSSVTFRRKPAASSGTLHVMQPRRADTTSYAHSSQ